MKEKLKSLMRGFNAWMEKVGVDKLLHFFVAAWVVAEFKNFGTLWGCIGLALVVVAAVVKECYIDEQGDRKDGLWSFLGGAVSLAIMLITLLLP